MPQPGELPSIVTAHVEGLTPERYLNHPDLTLPSLSNPLPGMPEHYQPTQRE